VERVLRQSRLALASAIAAIMLVLLAGPIVGLERNQTRRREAET